MYYMGKLSNKNRNLNIILAIISVALLLGIFYWFHYLIKNNYVGVFKEGFDTDTQIVQDKNTPETSHTVNLPINTSFSCQNKCGPQSQCSITREQCTSDVDCYGCQPVIDEPQKYNYNVRGQNDAGRLTYNATPRYSTLTTDIGTQAAFFKMNSGKSSEFNKVPDVYYGEDTWLKSFNEEEQLLDEEITYKYSAEPAKYAYLPTYPTRPSLTGAFADNGPLAANAYL
jgi:hypothetical protein